MQPFVFLTENQTAALISISEAVLACEAVLVEQGRGQASLSDPAAMFLSGDTSLPVKFKTKGGYLPGLEVCGFRIVGDLGRDGDLGEHHFCLLLDPLTAEPRGLIAQTELHRIRTAACGLLAVRALKTQATRRVALIGAGKIGAQFARGFHELFPELTLVVASRRLETAQDLADRVRRHGCSVEAMAIPDAVASCEAVVALSTALEPIMAAEAFRPGMTIVGMGEYHELPVGVLHAADRFIVDDLGFASVLGSLSHWLAREEITPDAAAARVDGTLSGLMAGRDAGRLAEADRVLAIVQGLAIADLAIADICRRKIQQI